MTQTLNRSVRGFFSRAVSSFKSAILAGALVLAPLGITIWVFLTLVGIADGVIGLLPAVLRPETWLGFPLPGLGVLLTVVLVSLVGYGMRYYTGRRVVELYEAIFRRVPVLNGIYHGFKQLIQTLFFQKGKTFRQAVLVEYPRRGIWCLAFLTNERPYMTVDDAGSEDLISVFLPTTPNPTSGFYLLVPRCDVRHVEIGVEEAFKLIMSAGIVTPDGVRAARRAVAPCADGSGGEDARGLAGSAQVPSLGHGAVARSPQDEVVEEGHIQ